jgi:hypothetical protein
MFDLLNLTFAMSKGLPVQILSCTVGKAKVCQCRFVRYRTVEKEMGPWKQQQYQRLSMEETQLKLEVSIISQDKVGMDLVLSWSFVIFWLMLRPMLFLVRYRVVSVVFAISCPS